MFSKRRAPRGRRINHLSIPDKANGILNLILVSLLLVVIRVWHLAVIQHDTRVEAAQTPTYKTVIEPAKRATIRDRFNLPLAINKIQYQAGVIYSHLREIPSVIWEKDSSGKKVKKLRRKEYIAQLANLLGKELDLDPDRLLDIIYSKAAFSAHIPYIVKEELTEQEFYRLKMLEKDWPGIYVREMPKRHYPKGRVASDIIGYMGAISRNEYNSIAEEMNALEDFLGRESMGEQPSFPKGVQSVDDAIARLKVLQERAYTINDYVGKTGIEGKFEEQLRGFYGKKIYYADAKGNFLREMENSRNPVSGNRILLTISAELQEFAEQLLMEQEKIREEHVIQEGMAPKQPWIRGGAIVAMDPNTGEVLALASFPRYDPNDFIPKGNKEDERKRQIRLKRWFESEKYIADIWNQKQLLERERFNPKTGMYEEEGVILTWENYLDFILPKNASVREGLQKFGTIKSAVQLQKAYENGTSQELLKDVENNDERLLILDLCRLSVNADVFSDSLIKEVGNFSISHYRDACAAFVVVHDQMKQIARNLFHSSDFKQWRTENEKEFLKEKRAEEKANHQYAKPYLDYLDKKENSLFEEFWLERRWECILAFLKGKAVKENFYTSHFVKMHNSWVENDETSIPWLKHYDFLKSHCGRLKSHFLEEYLGTMRSFDQLTRPLLGKYRLIRRGSHIPQEKDLASAFYPTYGYGYARSYAYRQAASQGSIFKIVTAYAALIQRYYKLKESGTSLTNLNPLTIDDHVEKQGTQFTLGSFSDGSPIPSQYKGGRLIKSLSQHIGKVDLPRALEHSSNPYFSLLAGDYLSHPNDLKEAAELLSYGKRTGIDLSGEVAGALPKDLEENRTGLYACAIGQHTLVMTPMQSAVMLSCIANGGEVLKPQIISAIIPTTSSEEDIHSQSKEVTRKIPLPDPVRNLMLDGLKRVVSHINTDGIASLLRTYQNYSEAIKAFKEISPCLVGKTSSAEAVEFLTLDKNESKYNRNHIWFGGIAFQEPISKGVFKNSELVVIVYLRHGGYGKDTAPVAAQIIKKWREIKREKEL